MISTVHGPARDDSGAGLHGARKPEKAAEFRARAELRKAAVRRYLWDAGKGVFTDYLWGEEKPSGRVTAATFAPLFFGLATKAQAERVAEVVRARLLKPGGLVTTTLSTGQQWDAPNAWAPLQWIAIEGLGDYGETARAETIAQRWMLKVITAYRASGKLMEKYNAEDPSLVTGGGEYPTQDGFGWTNGVLRNSWCFIRTRSRRAPARAGARARPPTTTYRPQGRSGQGARHRPLARLGGAAPRLAASPGCGSPWGNPPYDCRNTPFRRRHYEHRPRFGRPPGDPK